MSLAQEFLSWLNENTTNNHTRSKIKYLGSTYGPNDYFSFLKNYSGNPGSLRRFFSESPLEMEEIFKKSVSEFLTQTDATTSDQPKQKEASFITYIRENCVYINPVKGNIVRDEFFLDKNTYEPYGISVKAVKNMMPPRKEANFYKLQHPFINGIIEYIPFIDNEDLLGDEIKNNTYDGKTLKVTNYVMPQWRKRYKAGEHGKLDPAWLEFLEILVPKRECRDHLLRWVLRSLRMACPQFLCLIGAQGVGKNLLVDGLLLGLHGGENSDIGKDDTLSAKFNAVFDKKTLLFLDEIEVKGKNEHNTMKRLVNEYISIEVKGVDVEKVKRRVSMVVAANYTDSVYIDVVNSRKFTVLDLQTVKLDKLKPKEWIDDLVESFKHVDFQIGFYRWLEENYVDADPYETYQGETFEKVIVDTCFGPIRYALEKVFSKKEKEYHIPELRKEYKSETKSTRGGYYLGVNKIYEFFNAFRYNGKQVAVVDRERELLIPVNEFAYQSESDLDEDE